MKGIHADKKQDNSVATAQGRGGITMPAVPVLQQAAVQKKAAAEELPVQAMFGGVTADAKAGKFVVQQKDAAEDEQPLQMKPFQLKKTEGMGTAQLMNNGVVQRVKIKIGDKGALPGELAGIGGNFPGSMFMVALRTLRKMKDDNGEYDSVADIVTACKAHPDYIAGLALVVAAEEAAAARQAEAIAAAAALLEARNATALISTLSDGAQVRRYDIDHGTWQRIPPSPGKARLHDYELVTTIGVVVYKFHIHQSRHDGGDPMPGAIMKNDSQMPNAAPSKDLIDNVIASKGRPADL